MKESFLVYKEWNTLIESLEDEDRLFFYDTLFSFDGDEIPTFKSKHLQSVVNFVFGKIIENDKKYTTKCEKAKESANKRWNANASESMPTHANVKKAMHNDNDNDNDNVNESDIKIARPHENSKVMKTAWWVKAEKEQVHEKVMVYKDAFPKPFLDQFINYYSMPHVNGGISINHETRFDIETKLKSWWAKDKDEYKEQKPASSLLKNLHV